MIAAAQDDSAFQNVFKARFVKPREKMVTNLLKQAQKQGKLAERCDVEMLSIFVHGAFWYALLNVYPVDNDLARAIADKIVKSTTA